MVSRNIQNIRLRYFSFFPPESRIAYGSVDPYEFEKTVDDMLSKMSVDLEEGERGRLGKKSVIEIKWHIVALTSGTNDFTLGLNRFNE